MNKIIFFTNVSGVPFKNSNHIRLVKFSLASAVPYLVPYWSNAGAAISLLQILQIGRFLECIVSYLYSGVNSNEVSYATDLLPSHSKNKSRRHWPTSSTVTLKMEVHLVNSVLN